jgi:hypothetical protein
MAVSSTAMTRLGWVCDQFLNRLSFPGQPCALRDRVPSVPMRIRVFAGVAILLVLAIAGCGKRNAPQPPPDVPHTYPRPYPNE